MSPATIASSAACIRASSPDASDQCRASSAGPAPCRCSATWRCSAARRLGLIPKYSVSRIRSCANAPATTTPAAAGSSSRASTSASGVPVTPARMPGCGEPTTLATWSSSKDSWCSRASRCSRTCRTPGGIAPVGRTAAHLESRDLGGEERIAAGAPVHFSDVVLARCDADDVLYQGGGRVPVEPGQRKTSYSS